MNYTSLMKKKYKYHRGPDLVNVYISVSLQEHN